MHDIHMAEVSKEFQRCWQAAGVHIQNQAQGDLQSWLRAHLTPPFLEHLSFRLGNQLFFIQLQDVDDVLEVPGNLGGLLSVADGCEGHACLMPMQKIAGEWRCVASGWGLIDARTERIVNPVALISAERIEMTDWELQDFAVQVVRSQLEKDGRQLMSWQGNPAVDPSIWFVGEKGPEWVVVRAARWPERDAAVPKNIDQIAANCLATGKTGHFAVVRATNSNDPFDPQAKISGNFIPLFRGDGISVSYNGLKLIASSDKTLYTPPSDLSADLMREFVNWFNSLLEKGTVLPKMFTGVNRDGRQYIVDMSLVEIDIKKHYLFMRYVLFHEKSIAYAYKMRTVAELCKEPLIHQEQHIFYSGSANSYHSSQFTSQAGDGWHEGSKLLNENHTTEPEIFLQELLPNYFEQTSDDDLFSNIWNSIRDKVIWREREFKSNDEKGPLDFAQEVLENILPFPFKDSNLNNPELSERLAIDDSASADKFQIVCISVALFLIKRAVREALYDKFGTKFDSVEDFNHLAIQANEIANNIIAQQLKAADFPNYVNLQYLLRWDRRYHEAAADSGKTNLLEVILHSALRHATFSYEDEDAVVAADDMMFIEFNRIFDAYLIELRNMLGDSCLR
jgi:hypothetical protein